MLATHPELVELASATLITWPTNGGICSQSESAATRRPESSVAHHLRPRRTALLDSFALQFKDHLGILR